MNFTSTTWRRPIGSKLLDLFFENQSWLPIAFNKVAEHPISKENKHLEREEMWEEEASTGSSYFSSSEDESTFDDW